MILIDADAVGSVTYARLVRDGVVVPATRRFAFPADVNPSPGIRAWCVAPSVPAHTVLSGLAGLWVWHGGPWPGEVTVVGKRGLHRAAVDHHPGPARDRVTFHSGLAWRDPATTLGPIAIASPARCCSDALRWDAHRVAIPVVARTVATGAVPLASIVAEVRRDNLRGAGYARLAQLWRVLYPVLRESTRHLRTDATQRCAPHLLRDLNQNDDPPLKSGQLRDDAESPNATNTKPESEPPSCWDLLKALDLLEPRLPCG